MELILKQPVGKPPFIGILFENQFEAEKMHASLINTYHTHLYTVTFEPKGDKLDIKLNCSMNFNNKYKGVKYDANKLTKFLEVNRDSPIFNFSHIIDNLGTHIVVKSVTNRRLWVLKVEQVEVISEH